MPAPTRSFPARALIAIGALLLAACGDYSSDPTGYDPNPDPQASVVDVAFCTGLEPLWLAFQDGDGRWTRAQPVVDGARTIFRHSFTQGRGAVASARHHASGLNTLSIQYGAPAELAIIGDTAAPDCDFAPPRTLLGTVSGLDTNEVAFVSAGHFSRDAAHAGANPEFILGGLAGGPQDVLAMRATRAAGEIGITGMILRRNVDAPPGAELPRFDFASAEAFQPAQGEVTLSGLGVEATELFAGFRTSHSEHLIELVPGAAGVHTRTYHAIPAARLEAGDLQVLTVTSSPVGNVVRGATRWFRAPGHESLVFGPAPLAPQLSVAATAPAVRLRARFAPQAEYERFSAINYQQGQNTVVTLLMTDAYARRSAAGYDLEMPDLLGVEGFDPQWALHPGSLVIWTSVRAGGTLGLGANPVPRDGDTRRIGSDAGFITP